MITRVSWLPGSDRLQGDCHCGARIEAEDPTSVWDWLMAHPTHPRDLPRPPVLSEPSSPPAHLVSRATAVGQRTVPPA